MKSKKVLYFEVFLVGLFWGTSFVAISIVLRTVTPLEYLAVRWTIAGVLSILLVITKVFKVDFKNKSKKSLILLVLIQPCAYSLVESLGVQNTSASEASIMLALLPIATAFIVTFLLREKVKRTTLVAAFICFSGVIFTVAFEPEFEMTGKLIGYVYLTICVLLGGTYTVMSNKLAVKYTPTEVAVAMSVGGSICFNIMALFNGRLVSGYLAVFTNMHVLMALLYLAIFCSILCFMLYNHINSHLDPAQTALFISNSVTIIGVISAVLITGDSMSIYKAIGVGLIIFGVVKHGLDEMKAEDKQRKYSAR
ncbi:MAG: DMT family transporter [Clostridiales bacterium]|jgi:drug/metabolite transporter (DMT)-like permease|nr:DMT family transporter [Clostridiales bacterium]